RRGGRRGARILGGEGEGRARVRPAGRDGRRREAAADPARRRGLARGPSRARRPAGVVRRHLRSGREVGAPGRGFLTHTSNTRGWPPPTTPPIPPSTPS